MTCTVFYLQCEVKARATVLVIFLFTVMLFSNEKYDLLVNLS